MDRDLSFLAPKIGTHRYVQMLDQRADLLPHNDVKCKQVPKVSDQIMIADMYC
jgi:hypothetical protein